MKSFRFLLLTASLLWLVSSCKDPSSETTPSLPDWTEASHGNGVDPNYSEVFPQTKVNSLELKMTTADWSAIRADMTKNSGSDFGVGGGQMGGGNPPVGGGPGAGAGGALDLIAGDPIYVPVSMKYNGKEWYNVGFRLKGNSSLSSSWRSGIYKLPFRLKMDEYEDKYPEIKNQRFYGFKELSMSPGFSDNSLIREKVVADIYRQAGVPAAQTAFYKVYIDFGEGSKYCGVYTMVEVIDDTMIKSQFGENSGNIYKPESNFTTFTQTQFEKKNNETAADYSDVQTTVSVLNRADRTTNAAQWRSDLEKVFNVDHFVKWLAINTAIVNWDTYGAMAHNYYLYNAPGKGLMWIPWDHNMSMTSTSTSGGQQQGGGPNRSGLSLSLSEVAKTWPLIRYIADDPIYYAKYKTYMKTFMETVFTSAKMNALFEQNQSLISPHVIGPLATEQTKYTHLTNLSAFTNELTTLKTHVATRNAAVSSFLK